MRFFFFFSRGGPCPRAHGRAERASCRVPPWLRPGPLSARLVPTQPPSDWFAQEHAPGVSPGGGLGVPQERGVAGQREGASPLATAANGATMDEARLLLAFASGHALLGSRTRLPRKPNDVLETGGVATAGRPAAVAVGQALTVLRDHSGANALGSRRSVSAAPGEIETGRAPAVTGVSLWGRATPEATGLERRRGWSHVRVCVHAPPRE